MTLHIGAMMPDRSLDESILVKAITQVAADLAGLRDQAVQKKTPCPGHCFFITQPG